MKTAIKNSVPAIVFFAIMLTIALLATNASAQTTTDEPTVAFRYDGFSNPDDAPATISKERLQDDQIMIKEERYSTPLNGKIGLPSMEDIKTNLLEEVYKQLNITITLPLFTSTDKEKDSLTAHLIKEDWGGSHC